MENSNRDKTTPVKDSPTQNSPRPDRPRLTEQEKKNNHIASEQKRRQAIRDGFDRLAALVPGMAGQGRSENAVLSAAVEHMRDQINEYHSNIEMARELGVDVSDMVLTGVPVLPEQGQTAEAESEEQDKTFEGF